MDGNSINYTNDEHNKNNGQYIEGQYNRALRETANAGIFNTVFGDWLHPERVENRQMGNQIAYDNTQYANKLDGMIKAGINPLTAAAGLAGAGSGNVPSPSSSNNPIGDVAGAVGSVAGAGKDFASSVVELEKLPSEIENIQSDSSKNFADIGLTNAQIQAVLTDNTYRSEDWKARLNVQRQQFENMKEEYRVIKVTHDQILKNIEQMQSQIEVNGSIKDYNEALTLFSEENRRWLKELNDFRINHKLFPYESGIDGYIICMTENGASDEQFDRFIDKYSNYRGRVQKAESSAFFESDNETAYSRAHNKAKGEYNADPYQQQIRDVYDTIDTLSDDIKQMDDLMSIAITKHDNGEISDTDFKKFIDKVSKAKEEAQRDLDKMSKEFAKHKYEFGHRSIYQSILEDATKIGIGVGAYGLSKGSPTVVKGFGY